MTTFILLFCQLQINSNQKAIHHAQFSPHLFHWRGKYCQTGCRVASRLLGLGKRRYVCHSSETDVRIKEEICWSHHVCSRFLDHFIFVACFILTFALDTDKTKWPLPTLTERESTQIQFWSPVLPRLTGALYARVCLPALTFHTCLHLKRAQKPCVGNWLLRFASCYLC